MREAIGVGNAMAGALGRPSAAECSLPAPVRVVIDRNGKKLLQGDCRAVLPNLHWPTGYAAVIVTSPPYWRQRKYTRSVAEIGREEHPSEWAAALVDVFRLCRCVLKPDGSLWLNVGDKYAAGGMGGGGMASRRANWRGTMGDVGWRKPPPGYKPKDLTLAPFMLAEALRQDGWYLRQTIVWEKVAAVEPPRLDRIATSHEYLFQFSASESSRVRDPGEPWWNSSVWRIPTDGNGSHVAQMPVELARRCIVASTQPGDVVLDPFAGVGTTLVAAELLGRRSVGVELSDEYIELAQSRLRQDSLLLFSEALA